MDAFFFSWLFRVEVAFFIFHSNITLRYKDLKTGGFAKELRDSSLLFTLFSFLSLFFLSFGDIFY